MWMFASPTSWAPLRAPPDCSAGKNTNISNNVYVSTYWAPPRAPTGCTAEKKLKKIKKMCTFQRLQLSPLPLSLSLYLHILWHELLHELVHLTLLTNSLRSVPWYIITNICQYRGTFYNFITQHKLVHLTLLTNSKNKNLKSQCPGTLSLLNIHYQRPCPSTFTAHSHSAHKHSTFT
jgi:hypothetical protein